MKASRVAFVAGVLLVCLSGMAVSGAAAPGDAATGANVADGSFLQTGGEIPIEVNDGDNSSGGDSGASNESGDSGESEGSDDSDESGDSGPSTGTSGPTISESIDSATNSSGDGSGSSTGSSGEGSENESSGNESDPLSTEVDDGGGLTLSPSAWILNGVKGLADRGLSEIESSINVLQAIIVDMPAPGNLDNPRSVVQPSNGWWPAVYLVMGAMYVFGMLSLIVQTAKAFTITSPKKRRDTLIRLAVSWFMTLGGAAIAPLGLHLMGDISLTLVPDGEMFTQTIGDFAQLGAGIIIGGILVGVASTVVAAGIVGLFMVFVIAHLVVAFWPIVWPAWAANGQARQYGSMGINLYYATCFINFFQASMLLLMYHIPWSQSPMGHLGGFIALTAGLIVTVAYIPIKAYQQAHMAAATTVGISAAMTAGSMGKAAAKETREAPQKVQQFREKHFSSGPEHRRVGSVGESRDGSVSSTPNTSASSSSSSPDSGYHAQRGMDAQQTESRNRHETSRINRGYH